MNKLIVWKCSWCGEVVITADEPGAKDRMTHMHVKDSVLERIGTIAYEPWITPVVAP